MLAILNRDKDEARSGSRVILYDLGISQDSPVFLGRTLPGVDGSQLTRFGSNTMRKDFGYKRRCRGIK